MGNRVTRPAQSGQLLRAKSLRHALEQGAPPALMSAGAPGTSASSFPSSIPSPNFPEANPNVITAQNTQPLPRQYLDQIFENSPDALLVLDLSFRVQHINREFERLFGYSAAEALSQPIGTLICPAARDAESSWIQQSLQRGETLNFETQRRHRDGAILDLSLSACPLTVNGNHVAFYVRYSDVSARKRAEALNSALYSIAEKAASAQDLQQLFAAIHGIVDDLMFARNFSIAIHDPESQLLSFPYYVDERELAPTPAKSGRSLVEYILRTGEPLLATPQLLQKLKKRGEIESAATPALQSLIVPLKVNHHAFGALVLKNYSESKVLTDRDQEVLTVISRQLAPIIDHKRNEQALRRSELRYRSMVQTAVYGIYRSSLEGQFLDVNPALIGMLGYNSAMEVLALDPQKDVFVDPGEYARLIQEFRSTGRMDGFEARWKRKDGAHIIVRISGRAVASENEPADVLEAIAEDITERRVLEDQFRQSQKMEAVGRLAGGIAHDFNNLLMVVSGYSEVLLDKLPPTNPLYAKAEAIQQASDRATTLTRQLLAFSRKQHLELKVVDVNSIIEDMERLLRPLIGEDIELTTQLSPSVGCTRADSGQLEQVIMNLVVNAKDAMPNGGKISIRTTSVALDSSYRPENTLIKQGQYVMISVSDNGSGMDRETQARVFEPFFTTKEKGKGTGLGLSTVYGIIKQSGGYVFVQSELKRGTTFTIYFPRVDEPCESASPTPASAASAGGSETILLVEDEASVRQLVRDTLESRGYRVLEAANGNAALEQAASYAEPIHLIVTDVIMPGLGGAELAQQLLLSRPATKVLYLSGYAEDAFSNPLATDPNKAFLQKPFTLQSLSRKVREVLGSSAK